MRQDQLSAAEFTHCFDTCNFKQGTPKSPRVVNRGGLWEGYPPHNPPQGEPGTQCRPHDHPWPSTGSHLDISFPLFRLIWCIYAIRFLALSCCFSTSQGLHLLQWLRVIFSCCYSSLFISGCLFPLLLILGKSTSEQRV